MEYWQQSSSYFRGKCVENGQGSAIHSFDRTALSSSKEKLEAAEKRGEEARSGTGWENGETHPSN